MRRAMLTVCAIAVIATGCTTRTAGEIPASPPASLPAHAAPVSGPALTGTVRDTAGRPVAGATVTAAVLLSSAEEFGRGVTAFATLGLSCLAGCSAPHETGYSAKDGSFAVAVPRPNHSHDRYALTVTVPRGRARVATSLELPTAVRRGQPVGTVFVAAGVPRIQRIAGYDHLVPPGLPGRFRGTTPTATAHTEHGEPPVIDTSSVDINGGYDPRLLEDERLLLTTAQRGVERHHSAVFSSSLEVRGHAVPISRHAACRLEGSRGQWIRQQPCGLTDGVLDDDWQPHDDPACADGPCAGSRQHDHRDVIVRLRHHVIGSLLVIRGCTGCRAAVSTGGRDFHTVATAPFGSTSDVLVRQLDGQRITAVRVETDTGGFFDELREVSVFGRP